MATFTEPARIARLEAITLVRAALNDDEAAFAAFQLANPLSDASLQQFLALIWLARDILLALNQPDRDLLLYGLAATVIDDWLDTDTEQIAESHTDARRARRHPAHLGDAP